MAVDVLRERGTYAAELSNAIADGAGGLRHVPGLLRRVLVDDGWQSFVTLRGILVEHSSFAKFVTTAPLSGLGAESVEQLQRLVGDCVDVLDLIDQAMQRPPGRPVENVNNINSYRPMGTTVDQALRRLRKDAPELHGEVVAGNLSAHAAMVRAGLRPKTATIRVTDPVATARTLRRAMTPEDLARLRDLLLED